RSREMSIRKMASRAPLSDHSAKKTPFFTWNGHRYSFTLEPPGGVGICPGWRACGAADRDRRANVRGTQHLVAFRNDAEQGNGEDFEDILDTEHLVVCGAAGIEPGNEKVLVEAFALLGLRGLRIEKADDAIGIAHRRDFRIDDYDGDIGMAHGECRAPLDAGRTVTDHPVEFFAQLR